MPTKTRAIVIRSPRAGFALEEVVLDDPQADEVIVKMVACGICHTDLSIESGAFPSPYPTIPGHEGGGIIQAVGASVETLSPGDKVLLSYTSCSKCSACRDGTPCACGEWEIKNFHRKRDDEVGDSPVAGLADGQRVWGSFFGQSSMAEHAVVAAASCVKVGRDTDLRLLAPLGCGLQTGSGAVFNRLKPPPDSSIAIFGCGAVGMSAVLAAADLGVKTIIAVDLIEDRRRLAKEFGATHSIDGASPTLVDDIKAVTTNQTGVSFAVEATGNIKVFRKAYESLHPFGHITSCGSPGPGVNVPIGIHEHINSAKVYSGVLMGCGNPNEAIPHLVQMQQEGKFPIERIAQYYRIDEFQEAVEAMHSGKVIKPVIVFD